MDIFDIIKIDPNEVKVHLAGWNGVEDPLDVYFDGSFQQWQEHQRKRNFQRPHILSLIRYPGDNLWLFVGVYESKGISGTDENGYFFYNTELSDIGRDLRGRLIVHHIRKGRNSYPYGENVANHASLYSLMPEPLAFSDFTSYREVLLTRKQLELLFKHQFPSWKSSLSSVAGVYLLSDRSNGKLYVGGAYGQGGIWGRWSEYASNYHGGNRSLKRLYMAAGNSAFSQFEYSILETCDIETPAEQVIAIESRWKNKLLSRDFGYNDN